MEDGWTRFTSSDVPDTEIRLRLWARSVPRRKAWLSQANHIFSRVRISCKLEDFAPVRELNFTLKIPATTADTPKGFLFLCSPEDFKTGPSSFKWPDCPAYWSFDPSGAERLSTEDAVDHGFPSIQLSTHIECWSWDSSVYAGLRQFHEGKGFDPDSQDVARHLGLPLYQLCSERDAPFANIDERSSDGDDKSRAPPEEKSGVLDSANEDQAHASTVTTLADQDPKDSSLAEETVVSDPFNFMLSVQLTLMLFLVLCGLYEQVQ